MKAIEQTIFGILFPDHIAEWSAFAASNGIALEDKASDHYKLWRNRLCDVQSFWSHVWYKRNVFVTNDSNFHKATKKLNLEALSGGQIVRPSELP
jgi:hypothetical protein